MYDSAVCPFLGSINTFSRKVREYDLPLDNDEYGVHGWILMFT